MPLNTSRKKCGRNLTLKLLTAKFFTRIFSPILLIFHLQEAFTSSFPQVCFLYWAQFDGRESPSEGFAREEMLGARPCPLRLAPRLGSSVERERARASQARDRHELRVSK